MIIATILIIATSLVVANDLRSGHSALTILNACFVSLVMSFVVDDNISTYSFLIPYAQLDKVGQLTDIIGSVMVAYSVYRVTNIEIVNAVKKGVLLASTAIEANFDTKVGIPFLLLGFSMQFASDIVKRNFDSDVQYHSSVACVSLIIILSSVYMLSRKKIIFRIETDVIEKAGECEVATRAEVGPISAMAAKWFS